jgi:transcription antitermination factor NusG
LAVSEIPGTWWVAHTRSRHEKALAADLAGWGIAYFLPMVQRTQLISGRKFKVLFPLFPGYVFFAGEVVDRYRALTTAHIACVLPVVDQARLRDELGQIEKALRSPAGFDPYPFLHAGTRCAIRSGPLQGIHGVVVQRDGITRLVLQVELLGQAIATQVDPDIVEALD